MSFTTFEYLLFFLLTLSCFYLGPVSFRKPILLLASYIFYASWNWKFIPLLLAIPINVYTLASAAGLHQRDKWFDVVLPLGISFHTFQSISYVVDVYRNKQAAIRKPLDYALFIAFFPQLVAGPIVRAEQFFLDLYNWQTPTFIEIRRGCFLVVMGLTKKLALADNFATISDTSHRC